MNDVVIYAKLIHIATDTDLMSHCLQVISDSFYVETCSTVPYWKDAELSVTECTFQTSSCLRISQWVELAKQLFLQEYVCNTDANFLEVISYYASTESIRQCKKVFVQIIVPIERVADDETVSMQLLKK